MNKKKIKEYINAWTDLLVPGKDEQVINIKRVQDTVDNALTDLFQKELDKAYERGWNRKVVAHHTNDGWCCACSADIMEVQTLLENQKKELLEEITHWMRIENEISVIHKSDWNKSLSKLKSK